MCIQEYKGSRVWALLSKVRPCTLHSCSRGSRIYLLDLILAGRPSVTMDYLVMEMLIGIMTGVMAEVITLAQYYTM